jgi:hypothetical protein
MAINLPNSPTNGQTVTLADKTLVYNSTSGTWNVQTADSSGGSLSISDTAPSSPSDGDMWFDSSTLTLYAYYDDGNSQQWIDLAGQATTLQATSSDTAPANPSTGAIWFDTANLNLFVYYSDGSSNQWVQMNSEAPAIPEDLSDLTDTTNLLFDGQYSSLTGAPTSSTAGALGTLTKTFAQNEESEITLSETISPVPNVSVFKEVPQGGLTSKGNWDVNANATNYEFFDEKPLNYNTTTLTPSATGDGTFDSSNPISRRHIPASTAATTYATYGAGFSGGMFGLGLYDWGGALLSDDGTKFWMVAKNKGTNSDEAHIYAWTLSTPFRVDTAAAVGSTAIKVITEMSNITALLFNNDGTKIVCANGNNFYQFDLSTAYDLSTMGSGTESNWRIDLQRDPQYIDWSGDGDKLIVTEAWTSGGYSTRVRVFDLNTPYDITTMANLPVGTTTSFDANNPYYSIYSSNIYQKGWKISQDGLKFYAIDSANGKTLTKELPSPWVMRTGTVTTGDQYGLGDGNNWLTAAEDDYDLITGNYYKPQWTQNGSAIIIFNGTVAPNYLDIIPLPATQVFSSTDVGKKVVGNSGSAVITATSGTYKSVTAFADTSAISSWQLFGAEGKADGSGIKLSGYSVQSDIVFPTGASGSGASMVYNNNVSPADSTLNSLKNVVLNSTGTIALTLVGSQIQRWNLSTAFDLSTMTEDAPNNNTNQMTTNMTGFAVKPDGTRFWVSDYNQDLIKQFTMSTAWSPSTASYDGYYMLNNGGAWNNFSGGGGAPSSSNFNPFSFQFNSDGTKMITIMWDNNPYHSVVEFTLSTGWDMSTMSYTSFANFDGNSDPEAIAISPDGLKLMMHGSGLGDGGIEVYSLPSAFSVGNSGNSLTKTSGVIDLSTLTGNSNNNITNGGLSISNDGKRMWVIYNNNSGSNPIYEITGGTTTVHPYSTYFPSLTTTGGQINSSYWVDLDSMVADETKNGGDVFYAVSTDDRTSWGVIKDGDGVRKIVKNNSGTWQYNNDGGTSSYYDFSNPTAGATSTFTAPSWNILAFSTDGSKLIAFDNGYLKLKSYNLSTAWDISTISSSANAESSISTGDLYGATISADGTKLIGYVNANGYVYEYTMSTPFDVTTLTADGNTNSLGGASTSNAFNWFIKPGTYDTVYAVINRHLYKYTFTGGSITTGTVTRDANFLDLDPANQKNYINNGQFQFKPDGTEFYIGQGTDDIIEKWTLSTAWDITTATKSSETVSSVDARSIWLKPNGEKIYYIDQSDSKKIKEINIGGSEYGTNETWVNGTNNNEHATLQEALGAQSFNRMDKAQLQAVTDPNHYVLGDTLDLMIAPYATSGTSPLSDGVTIGYQADALIKQAINGTDYEAEFPATNKVKIKSLAAQNLKIRII